MSICYLGIGSNLGDRLENISSAIDLLEKNDIKILKKSSIIETDPAGGPKQNKYLNAVIKITTKLTPINLLKTLNNIEEKLKRIRSIKDGPRTIDLDILLFDDQSINLPELTIPHPRMLDRSFVMEPLKEIEPELATKLLNENI